MLLSWAWPQVDIRGTPAVSCYAHDLLCCLYFVVFILHIVCFLVSLLLLDLC